MDAFGSEQGNVVTIHEVLFNVENFELALKFDHLGPDASVPIALSTNTLIFV